MLTRRVLILARQRTIDQDPAFGLRMLVDIGIRALSPAVNDPTTAVQALDCIETLLIELYRRRPASTIVAGDDGTPRGLFRAADVGAVPRSRADGDPPLRRRLDPGGAAPAGGLRAPRRDHQRAARARVELEQRLLDEALAAAFPDVAEREIASHPDRLGLGSAA